ncbi:carbamoyltransferase HypF [Brunnivagina elsteri CCALA 953]|uniref:Carbamoyltransferase HypF n=1 Tax=Brunnivagina elsteri CCALA 953 TaxID=987040 RepID=A0A2A2TFC5_9CYAN|nr:carbamoyltransferase HypF [Calothrix elsteri CCALA 953]
MLLRFGVRLFALIYIVCPYRIACSNLACDATNKNAVKKLRQRKQRHHKPFALMARDIAVIEQHCTLNAKERELLQSPIAPIVLINKRAESINQELSPSSPPISPSVAPGQNTFGFILPYTPLHHLILKRMNRPIVFTSGNISDEPQCIDNDEAREKLGGIADYFLFHDREIVNRVDDSIVRVIADKVKIIRRARGYAPAEIQLPDGFIKAPPILAMGGELKNTFCLLHNGKAILSQHLGDLENAATFQEYKETLNLYLNLFEHKPEVIVVDKHPEYLSTKLGKKLAITNDKKLVEIQHHHAHVAACMAENQLPLDTPAILGIAFDGLGYGDDGTLWGGEFILANYRDFQRIVTFKPVPLIGGKQAIYQPWRSTYAHLISIFNSEKLEKKYHDLELFDFLRSRSRSVSEGLSDSFGVSQPTQILSKLASKGINSPLTSSVGRLFDAVAAAIDICREKCSYEGQAAIEMEALIDSDRFGKNEELVGYNFEIIKSQNLTYIDSQSMWIELLDDLLQQIPQQIIAAKFHQGLINIVVKLVTNIQKRYDVHQLAIAGGVFQNSILLERLQQQLKALEIKVITHSLVPTNDGGISLGQAAISAARLIDLD